MPDIKSRNNNKKNKQSQKEEKPIFSYIFSSLNDDSESNDESLKISDKNNLPEKKRGKFTIHTSNTEICKFNNKKTMKAKTKKNSLLNEISNNINVINHANEFYSGLINNFIKDIDKENENNNKKKKDKFNHFTQIPNIKLRRSSKTYKESK